MDRLHNIASRVGGRRLLLALGVLYVVCAVGYPFVPTTEPLSSGITVVMGVFVGGPGLVLLYGGYRLPRTNLRPETFGVVASWCLGGIGAMLALLALTELAAGLRDPIQNVLILTAVGSVAGFAAGSHDARAKSRELELEETIDQLQTANERLEQFAYAASHDLQEPLRMVSSYLTLLDRRYQSDLDPEAREYIEFAVDGADRMRAMVDSLLEYSQVSTGGEPLETTDAAAVLEGVLDDLQPGIEETGATITADELPTVAGDPAQLAQVFHNLLSNALVYSGNAPPRVHVGVDSAEEMWRFSVADEGVGIEAQYHDRIFDVFEQLHARNGDAAPDADSSAGGIGLALCERIVERHGGDIWVESEPGEGATFYFTIPRAASYEPSTDARSRFADPRPADG